MKFFTLLCLCFITTVQISKAEDNEPSSTGGYGFERENFNIRQDAANIKIDKDRIAYWKDRIDRELKLNRLMAANMAVKELAKAKSDLKRDVAYLKADVKNLKKNHRLVIKQTRAEVKDHRATIRSLAKKIRKAKRNDDVESAQYYAALRDTRKKDLADDTATLGNLIQWQEDNLAELKQLDKDAEEYVGYADTYKPDKAIAAF